MKEQTEEQWARMMRVEALIVQRLNYSDYESEYGGSNRRVLSGHEEYILACEHRMLNKCSGS